MKLSNTEKPKSKVQCHFRTRNVSRSEPTIAAYSVWN